MIIQHNNFTFEVQSPLETGDSHETWVAIKSPTNDEILWECTLMGLWEDDSARATPETQKIWNMHVEGDYFQHTLIRHNIVLHPHTSYTANFHDMVRSNRQSLGFINNIYSTSEISWLSMGYSFSDYARRFWDQQVLKKLAIHIPSEERYRAII